MDTLPTPLHELISLPGGRAMVTFRRSARARNISLRIDPRLGAVVVTLPPRASRQAGMALLMDHADWVTDRIAALPGVLTLADGAEIMVRGIPHRIRHIPDGHGGAWLEDGEIRVAGQPAFLARRVRDLLYAEAKRHLSAKVAEKTAHHRLPGDRPVRRVTIKDTRTRWGSCAADGSLAFNWRLVMAPDYVLDYVAAHEVAHLRHMDHSRRFWARVGELTVHTDAAIAWMHEHGATLLRVN